MNRKFLASIAAAALALMAFASTASATTLETKGVALNAAETISLSAAGSILLTNTFNEPAHTCKKSTLVGTTTAPFTATKIGGPISQLTFDECTNGPVAVHKLGYFTIEHISGTTNGTMWLDSSEVTTPSPFGSLTCVTAATGTDIGKITGVKEGTAVLDISAVLNCGLITTKWSGTYNITTANLGITA